MRRSPARHRTIRPPAVAEVLYVHMPGRTMIRLPLRRARFALALAALTVVVAGLALGFVLRAQLAAGDFLVVTTSRGG